MSVSDACLTYLFADRVVGVLGLGARLRGEYAVKVPSSDALAALGLLERQLLAVALSSLYMSASIDIRYAYETDEHSSLTVRRSGTVSFRLTSLAPESPC
jgi:hypothetical protein